MHFVNTFSEAVLECSCCDPTPCLLYSREAALILLSGFCRVFLKARERLMPTLHFTLMYGQAFRPLLLGLFMCLSVLLD